MIDRILAFKNLASWRLGGENKVTCFADLESKYKKSSAIADAAL
jgi:hypothetical protein